jgi:hypothetical protein
MAFLSKNQIPWVLPKVLPGYVFRKPISDFVAVIFLAGSQNVQKSPFGR